jgi:LPS O-antigen subunit length determinant protein (WzzB/FepE family)
MSAAPSDKTPARDVEPEQEMDLGRIWRSVIARWWLLLVGFVVGAIVGLLVSLGGGKEWKATAEIYLGQPLTTSGGPGTSAPTSLGLATAYINQLAQLKHAAKASGLTVAQLNGALSVKPILGLTGTKIGQPAPLMLLSVTGPKRIGVQLAAEDFAHQVVNQFQPYTTQKIKIIQARLTQESAQIADINRRLKAAENAQAALASSAANTALVANYAQIIATLSNERFSAQDDIVSAKESIAQALGIESPRIVSHPESASQGGPSRRSGVIIGAIIGLVIGLLVAIFWEPVGTQVRKHQSEPA